MHLGIGLPLHKHVNDLCRLLQKYAIVIRGPLAKDRRRKSFTVCCL